MLHASRYLILYPLAFMPVSRAHQHTCPERRTALVDCALRSGCNYTACREGGIVMHVDTKRRWTRQARVRLGLGLGG